MVKLLSIAVMPVLLMACGERAPDPVPLANDAAALDRQIEARGNALAAEAEADANATAAAAITEAEREGGNGADVPANQL